MKLTANNFNNVSTLPQKPTEVGVEKRRALRHKWHQGS